MSNRIKKHKEEKICVFFLKTRKKPEILLLRNNIRGKHLELSFQISLDAHICVEGRGGQSVKKNFIRIRAYYACCFELRNHIEFFVGRGK